MSKARFYKVYITMRANQGNRTAHRYKRLASFATESIAQEDEQWEEVQLQLGKDVSLAKEGQ